MLELTIDNSTEFFNENTNSFIKPKEGVLKFEHSLISLHKWEIKWKIPFLGKDEKTKEQIKDYIRCMSLQPIDEDTLLYLVYSYKHLKTIKDYIDEQQTATWFKEEKGRKHKNQRAITAELIYYWMIQFNIPVEFEKWHLSQLLTLINVCNEENKAANSKDKPNRRDTYNRHQAARAAYRSKHGKK